MLSKMIIVKALATSFKSSFSFLGLVGGIALLSLSLRAGAS
jgi:hypothetical protein